MEGRHASAGLFYLALHIAIKICRLAKRRSILMPLAGLKNYKINNILGYGLVYKLF
jgi:hypothetical protein